VVRCDRHRSETHNLLQLSAHCELCFSLVAPDALSEFTFTSMAS
jgi:hypothetical protein